MALLRIPILPFAVGLYLPLSLTAATMLGGLAKFFVNQNAPARVERESGLLLSSGFVGGDACTGVIIALLTLSGITPVDSAVWAPDWLSLVLFIGLAILLTVLSTERKKSRFSY